MTVTVTDMHVFFVQQLVSAEHPSSPDSSPGSASVRVQDDASKVSSSKTALRDDRDIAAGRHDSDRRRWEERRRRVAGTEPSVVSVPPADNNTTVYTTTADMFTGFGTTTAPVPSIIIKKRPPDEV